VSVEKGSATPHKVKVATLSKAQLREIAETKLPDLNARDILALEINGQMPRGVAKTIGSR